MRTKIDFGIDLGTTNSAIAKIENGKPMVVTTGRADIIPSCVAIQTGGRILVGDRAKTIFSQEKERELRDGTKPNSFVEFKREMANPFTYNSSNLGKDISPEELSAEVLKTLKSFVTTEKLNSIVVTVPAKFNIAQKQATINAGKLAGFDLVVLLEEPVAACLAYNMEAQQKKGTWLVFDFGGGTFDAALVKKDDEGMMKIVDTGGDNELGGKDLDLEIVDKLIIPFLEVNYNLSSYFNDKIKSDLLRFVMKRFAEDAKIELSFSQSTDLLKTYPGDIDLKDDDGKDICLNIDFNQDLLHTILESKHKRAIDLALKVLEKNNIHKKDLDAIILVGGPTLSPVFQKMIKAHISDKIDTSINPMTIVAKGAALYASTVDSGDCLPEEPDGVYLDIKYESATIEPDTLINVKINKDKTKISLPANVKLLVERGDKGFNIQQDINTSKVSLIELQLNVGVNNVFNFRLVDDKGNNVVCVPSSISFMPIDIPDATNNYFIGIEIWDKKREMGVFKGLRGLEKNKPLKNAVGVISDIKTPKQLVPGKSDDKLEIRIFQGEDDAEGKDSFLSDHVMSVIITGDDVEKVIPAQSDIEVTLKFFEEGGAKPTCSVFFPDINWTHKIELPDFKRPEVAANWVSQEIDKDIARVEEFLEENNSQQLDKCLTRLEELKQDLKNNENNPSGRITVLKNVRENRREIENHISNDEWPKVSEELKSVFYKAEELIEKIDSDELEAENLNMDKVHTHLEEFRSKVEQIIRIKDTTIAKEVISEISQLIMALLDAIMPGMRERKFIEYIDAEFSKITWINPTKARQLTNLAISNINNNGGLQELERICQQISDLIDRTVEQPPIPEPK